jgi:hypothetical protein
MSIDSDELVVLTQTLAQDEPSAAQSISGILQKTLLSTAIPFGIGSAVTGVLTELAGQRWRARVIELLASFATRLTFLTDAIDSKDYYSSEEFQALLLEAIDQERTNRYAEKRGMLAQGLANSGTRTFVGNDSKETFFRILRDLSPSDIRVLRALSQPIRNLHPGLHMNQSPIQRVVKARYGDPTLYRLQGLGLVTSSQRLPAPNLSGVNAIRDQGALNTFIAKALAAEPDLIFTITQFGRQFLMFLVATDSNVPNRNEAVVGFQDEVEIV